MKRLLFVLLLAARMQAAEPAELLMRSDVYRNPLDGFAIDVELTSVDGARKETSKFRVYGKGSDRSLVEFLAPAAEKGKALLMLRDAMWIYLPSASRPIRISPMQRLMGQASNGDVARTSFAADYRAVRAAEEPEAWVLDLEARDAAMSYRRVRLRIARETYEPVDAEFFVASGKPLKKAHYRRFGLMAGRRTVTEVEIEDLLRPGRRTVLRYSNLVPRDNPDSMFAKDGLGR